MYSDMTDLREIILNKGSLHYLDSNEIPVKKTARWELHKNAAWYFEQILEAALYKAATLWSLTSHLTNYPNKISKRFCVLLEK